MLFFRNAFCAMLFTCCIYLLKAQPLPASRVSPYGLKGSFGTSVSFYSSNEIVQTRPSFVWNTYANFTAKMDKVIMPVSFVANQYDNSGKPVFFSDRDKPDI